MPLLRIEMRDRSQPSDSPPEPPRRRDGDRQRQQSGATPAILAGAAVGLLAIAGISGYVISQRRATPPPAVPSVAPVATIVPFAGVPPLNSDYSRDTIVAYVSGEPYTMAQLEAAVRVAKTIAAFSQDEVPAYGEAAMREFQVNMLRLEIDGLLLRQALKRDGLVAPAGDVGPVIDGYLKQYNATSEQLAAAMKANGVTDQQLRDWFAASRDSQFYIQTQLMAGKDAAQRAEIVQAWLDQQWQTQEIKINFYEPATPTPGGPSGTAAP